MSKTTKTEEDATTPAASTEENTSDSEQPVCGVVMPISAIDGCSAEHWQEVKNIIFDAINSAGYKPCLVSEADDSGIIQGRIIQNLYKNEIVVVDVSAKNPNVMFELGIRLAFDKPTIIVKDDFTDYSFDTSVIEHIPYPRTLRFNNIVQFKKKLKEKIEGTIKAVKVNPDYTSFLKHFGEFKVAGIESKSVPMETFLMTSINEIKNQLANLKNSAIIDYSLSKYPRNDIDSRDIRGKIIPNTEEGLDIIKIQMFIKSDYQTYSKENNITAYSILSDPKEKSKFLNFVLNRNPVLNKQYKFSYSHAQTIDRIIYEVLNEIDAPF
ncbi:hypothetical protein LDB17_14605 [Dysgonomonas sp. Shenzhen-Wh21]|uniref:hypothetical protein n=1 Tax=Dysgonomonas TaxID=156973 RepID=UPI00208E21F0|nr:hypothetical protein [Dysgonomonas mossii]